MYSIIAWINLLHIYKNTLFRVAKTNIGRIATGHINLLSYIKILYLNICIIVIIVMVWKRINLLIKHLIILG